MTSSGTTPHSGAVEAAGSQNGDHADDTNPHPGRVFISRQYVTDEWINRQLMLLFKDSGKEFRERSDAIDLIDSLVNKLQLYVLMSPAALVCH